jgi:hypothetical protein
VTDLTSFKLSISQNRRCEWRYSQSRVQRGGSDTAGTEGHRKTGVSSSTRTPLSTKANVTATASRIACRWVIQDDCECVGFKLLTRLIGILHRKILIHLIKNKSLNNTFGLLIRHVLHRKGRHCLFESLPLSRKTAHTTVKIVHFVYLCDCSPDAITTAATTQRLRKELLAGKARLAQRRCLAIETN